MSWEGLKEIERVERVETPEPQHEPQREAEREPQPQAAAEPAQRLVPNSAIQVLDFTLGTGTVAGIVRRYFEDTDAGDPALYGVELEDDVLYHPVTQKVADAAASFAVTGTQALAPFLDTWLPVPVLRVLDAGTGSEWVGLDEGPTNWARVFIARVERPDAEPSYRIALAFDTTLDRRQRQAGLPYAAPTSEDAWAGAVFRFSDQEADVAGFVSEAWVDDWLREAYDAGRAAAEIDDDGIPAREPQLRYLACYLTLLGVLAETCDIPDIAFTAPDGERHPVGVELALDLGHGRSIAMVREIRPAGGRGPAQGMSPVAVRDFTEPWRVHEGLLSSRVEFAAPGFGREALSRLSGRSNAFFWPSVARIGFEAERIAAEQPTCDAALQPSSAVRYLWDDAPATQPWRFARPAVAGAERGGLVAGLQLARVTDDGRVVEAGEASATPTKPRFSRASLVTFLAAELITHAIATINAPDRRGQGARAGLPRRIERILVTAPAGMLERERAALKRRIEDAVRLVWQTPGWFEAGQGTPVPRRPEVRLVGDTATAAQLVYLHNEIAAKFHNRAREYFQLVGRQRLEHPGGRSLRVATLDIGAGTTGVAIATYGSTATTAVVGAIDLVDGMRVGSDDVVKAVVEAHIVPALTAELARCRIAEPEAFLADLVAGKARGRPSWLSAFGRRLVRDLLHPLGLALLKAHVTARENAGDVASRHTIGSLLALAGAKAQIVADELDGLAAEEGAEGFACSKTPVSFLQEELSRTTMRVLDPVASGAAHLFEALDCDVVLLAGWAAQIPAVGARLLAGMPTRPGQLVQLASYRVGHWYPRRSAGGVIGDGKTLGVVGALLASGEAAAGGVSLPADLRPRDPMPPALNIGRLDADGLVRDEGLLGTLAEAQTHGNGGAESETLSAVLADLPAAFGVRRLPLETWPATPVYRIGLARESRSRLKLPLRATFGLRAAERGGPEELELVRVVDADGGRIAPEAITFTFDTTPAAGGYWLETGGITFAAAEPAP